MSTFANNNDIVFAAARRALRAPMSGLDFVHQFSQSEHWEEAQMRAKMAQMRAEMEQMRIEMALMRAEMEKLQLAAVKAERDLAATTATEEDALDEENQRKIELINATKAAAERKRHREIALAEANGNYSHTSPLWH